MQDLINRCKEITQKYREDISRLIPGLKLSIQEECNKLVREVVDTPALKTIEAIEFYMSEEGQLMFDFLTNPELSRPYVERDELRVTTLVNVQDDRIVQLYRVEMDEAEIPGRFINMVNLLRTSELLIPIMFEDTNSLTFWIDLSIPPSLITEEIEPLIQIPISNTPLITEEVEPIIQLPVVEE
jgi:hypothetical protein